jgi:hypothetical protein
MQNRTNLVLRGFLRGQVYRRSERLPRRTSGLDDTHCDSHYVNGGAFIMWSRRVATPVLNDT